MAPTTRSHARGGSRNRRSNSDQEDSLSRASTSRDSVITGRVTRSSARNSYPSASTSSSQRVSSHSSLTAGARKHSAAAYRIATNVLRSVNNVIAASSSVSRLAIGQGIGSPSHGASSGSDTESNFDVELGPADEERISQGDFKCIFDYLTTIQERLVYINKRLDNLLERWKTLYIPRDPRVSTTACESQNIDVASYNSSRMVCPVCYCDLLKPDASPVSTSCGHIYCNDCLIQVLVMDESKCPNCRKPLSPVDYHAVYFPQLLS